MKGYLLHGLQIRSPLILGALAKGPVADLEVILGDPRVVPPEDLPEGEVLVQLELNGRRFYTGTDDGRHYVFRVHGACDFRLDRELTHVECLPDPTAETEHLALLLRGSVIAFLLGLKHTCVLHASAVETGAENAVVAFVGGSGTGKSTMAALACIDGARLVSDDMVRLDQGEPPCWVGSSAELRLRQGAVPVIEDLRTPWHARSTIDGRIALRPPTTQRRQGSVTAVVIPQPTRTSRRLELRKLEPLEAVMRLAEFPRIGIWRDAGALEAHFDGITRLAEATPVFVADVPWGPPFPEGIGAAILEGVLAYHQSGVGSPIGH